MDHGEVDVPLCLNNAFSYAVLLFNNVYEVFLGIPSMRLFSKSPVSVLIPFLRNIEIFHILIDSFQVKFLRVVCLFD